MGASAQESLLLTQRTLLVSKVIFSAPNISTDSVLHTKQAINLNQDHSLSPRATGFLGVYTDWKKGYLISSSSCFALVRLLAASQVFCKGVWASRNLSHPLKCSIQACSTSPKIESCSISSGSMHSGFDAVAFPQGDGCCGVRKATGWHLHKKKWKLSNQGRERGAEASTAQHLSHHCTLIAAPRQSFSQTENREGTWK